MSAKALVFGVSTFLLTNLAFAQPTTPPRQLPLEDGGMLALTVACLAIGIGLARGKRK